MTMKTHNMGGVKYQSPARKQSFGGYDPHTNPGRTPREQEELENGMRMNEEWELWVHHQEQLQQMNDSRNF